MKIVISCALLLMLLGACTTAKLDEVAPPSQSTQVIVPESYNARVERFSAGETDYAGLYNNFEYKATLENSYIRETLIWKQAHYYEWNDGQKSLAREKSNQEMSSQTKVFLAFFTPSPKNDNLADSKTIWRIYIDAGGHRYEGKVVRIRLLLAELQALYPYMTRWTTPYEITFDVPTAAIESQVSTLTVTGPLGARSVQFKSL
jgi:hypothetical protein